MLFKLKMHARTWKTALAIVGVVAAEVADNAHVLPIPEKYAPVVLSSARVIVASLALLNIYRNPDSSPAVEPWGTNSP